MDEGFTEVIEKEVVIGKVELGKGVGEMLVGMLDEIGGRVGKLLEEGKVGMRKGEGEELGSPFTKRITHLNSNSITVNRCKMKLVHLGKVLEVMLSAKQ